jgi:DNA-binding LytR/AlgR family response regulator
VKRASAIIAEDEPLLRAEIRRSLESLWPELTICAEVADGTEAMAAIEAYSPDVVFLDIQMPGVDGLTVAERLSGKAHVVFITAFDQHALAAFEHGALDYVLKPISRERLAITVSRLEGRLSATPRDLQGLIQLIKGAVIEEPQYIKWLTVPRGAGFKLVTVGEIHYLRADNKYTSLFTSKEEFLLSFALKEVKQRLDPQMFWQIHRSLIVNVGAIDTVFRSFRGSLEVKLKGREELLPVSAAHSHLFRQLGPDPRREPH